MPRKILIGTLELNVDEKYGNKLKQKQAQNYHLKSNCPNGKLFLWKISNEKLVHKPCGGGAPAWYW